MKRSWLKRFTALLLAALLVTTTVYAAPNVFYDPDDEANRNNAINVYGWDKDKMESYTWTGKDGNEYTRQSDRELSMYRDIYTTNLDLAVELGLAYKGATGASAIGMISLALEEYYAGIREVPMGSNLVKYNYELGIVRQGASSGIAWCCAFIWWLAKQCDLIDNGVFTPTNTCATMESYFIRQKYITYRTRDAEVFGGSEYSVPGDIIFYYEDQGDGYRSHHIGIVVEVDDGIMKVVEGNSGDKVSLVTITKQSFSKTWYRDSRIYRPDYPDESVMMTNYFEKELSISLAAAAGVAAVLAQTEKSDKDGNNYNLACFTEDELEAIAAYGKEKELSPTKQQTQLQYLIQDLKKNYQELISSLRALPDEGYAMKEAVDLFMDSYMSRDGVKTGVFVRMNAKTGGSKIWENTKVHNGGKNAQQ